MQAHVHCWSLSLATPYLRKLIDEGSMIIVVMEHWLWPYELHRLNEILPDYTTSAISDKCLSSTSKLVRGCGGVAILWHKSLTIIPVDTNSDHYCAIQVRSIISIVGVYLSSANAHNTSPR